ncbi:hypothetical protein C1H46_019071 [Malus baccata]|uniref:Uncharacterized protein n=1 Tax=Malus baccata TaxID=106549 RepID=A0A540M9Z5_MALBA|nr:hypothetical protein C1H46_019071 [Malus baccata]
MSYPVATSSSSSGSAHGGISLSNTVHSEVAPCLPLPSLPVFCGASDHLRLFDEPSRNSAWLNRPDAAVASRIADLLRETDVSYLNLREDARAIPYGYGEPLKLHDEVLRYNPEAFEYYSPAVSNITANCNSHIFIIQPISPYIGYNMIE